MSESFPRQHARTQRFTLGEPRNISVSPDGERIVFLRSSSGDDPANALWVLDVSSGEERMVADPRTLLGVDDPAIGETTDEERARRERTRDGTTGITSYATDTACKVVAFALQGRIFTGGLLSGFARELAVDGPAFDPRPDPTASRLAYVSGRELRIGELDGSSWVLAGGDARESDTISWGSAEFIAAEEMHRHRGFWWSPDGTALAVCRVDTKAVDEWTIADPADPSRAARTMRYPAAGRDNAAVTMHLLGLDGSRREVDWDRDFFPYVAHVDWSEQGLVMSVQSRDQRGSMVVRVDTGTGEGLVIASDYDDAWIENVSGVPRLLPTGQLLTAADRDGVRRLLVDDEPITPDGLQVRSVAAVTETDGEAPTILFHANDPDEPTELHVYATGADGPPERMTDEPGVHVVAAAGGPTVVTRSATLDGPGSTTTVHLGDSEGDTVIDSLAETPSISTNVTIVTTGDRRLATAVLLPNDRDPDDTTPLPVLLDPYGGPHAQRVTRAYNAYLTSQWFADQGFAVVIADGRGTPGRGSDWERAVRHDLAQPPLEDQIAALEGAAEEFGCFDLDRVAIRGWSFGGYLAALAVLDRPDVFHAAIAGAPVTEWRLYDTHYTERYLGDPTLTGSGEGAAVYDANSLLPRAADLRRPLLLIHGLADDNVVAAHTLRLSSALLAAGRHHELLALVGVTHMTPQEVVAENLLLHQLEFLSRALDLDLEVSDRAAADPGGPTD